MKTSGLPAAARTYLRRLNRGLWSLPRRERLRVLDEIRSHLDERMASGAPEAAVRALGDPAALARSFRKDYRAAQDKDRSRAVVIASRLTRVAWKLVVLAAVGVVALLLNFWAVMLVMVARQESAYPGTTGLFRTATGQINVRFTVSKVPETPPGTEVLGAWLIPLCWAVAVLFWLLALWLLWTAGRGLIGALRNTFSESSAKHRNGTGEDS
jgi:uncharacterized membrane protein